MLRSEEISDGMQNESKWICCPQCGSKTRVKVYEETVLIKFPLYMIQNAKRVLGQCSKTEDGIKRRARYLKYRACFSPKKGDQQALFLFYVVSTQFRWHPLPGVRQ